MIAGPDRCLAGSTGMLGQIEPKIVTVSTVSMRGTR